VRAGHWDSNEAMKKYDCQIAFKETDAAFKRKLSALQTMCSSSTKQIVAQNWKHVILNQNPAGFVDHNTLSKLKLKLSKRL